MEKLAPGKFMEFGCLEEQAAINNDALKSII